MTDEQRGIGGAVGPPWPVDLLADLHAGVLDEAEAAELWPRVNADPEARAVIEALEATTADLASLGAAPAEPMPADVAARIDAALAGERSGAEQGVAPVVSIDAARQRRKRMLGWGGGLLTAAAAAVAVVAIVVPSSDKTAGTPDVAEPGTSESAPPLALNSGGLGTAIGEVTGVRDFGPFGSEEKLDACLSASGIDPDVKAEGIRPATIDGKPAVILLYTTGNLAEFRLVAVSPECGPGKPGVLVDRVVGGTGR